MPAMYRTRALVAAFLALISCVHDAATEDILAWQLQDAVADSSLLAVDVKVARTQKTSEPGIPEDAASSPAKASALRTAKPANNAIGEKQSVLGGEEVSRTSPSEPKKNPVELHNTLIRRIFVLCVSMYGTIAVLWAFYWQRLKTMSPAGHQSMERFYVALLCLSWASTSVGMHVLNKSLSEHLRAPAVISGVQMIMAVVVMGAASGNKLFSAPPGQLKRWLVVPVLFAGMLCSSFYAYERISLSLLTVVRNLTPLVALPIETVIMPPDKRPSVTLPVIMSILVMLLGAVIYGDGILSTLSFVGLAYALLNMTLAVTDRIMQRRLLTQECKDLSSDVCTIINNALGLIPTIILAAATHQLSDVAQPAHRANFTDPRVMTLLLISGLVGIGICYLGFQCQRAISATSFFVLQNVSKVAVVAAGVAFFADPIKSPSSVLGLLLSLGGSFMYGAANIIYAPPPKQDADTRTGSGEGVLHSRARLPQGAPPKEEAAILDRQLKQRMPNPN